MKNNPNLEIAKSLALIIVVYGFTEYLFLFIYPQFNPIRAALIGIASYGTLLVLGAFQKIANKFEFNSLVGGFSILVASLAGSLLVQERILSAGSAAALIFNVVLLSAVYLFMTIDLKKLFGK